MSSEIRFTLMDIVILKQTFNDFVIGETNREEVDNYKFSGNKLRDGVFVFSVEQSHQLFQGANLIIDFSANYSFHLTETPITYNKFPVNLCSYMVHQSRHYTIALVGVKGKEKYDRFAPVSMLNKETAAELEKQISDWVNDFNSKNIG